MALGASYCRAHGRSILPDAVIFTGAVSVALRDPFVYRFTAVAVAVADGVSGRRSRRRLRHTCAAAGSLSVRPVADAADFYLTAADREEERDENLVTASRMFAALSRSESGTHAVVDAGHACQHRLRGDRRRTATTARILNSGSAK
jgi:hypothetical protein